LPRSFPYALATFAAAVVLAFLPSGSRPIDAAPLQPLQAVLDVAEEIEESLKDLQEQARREQSVELAQLVEQMRKKLEEMKQPGVSEREALAKISDMQAALAEQQAVNDTALVDKQFANLGEAMMPAAVLENAGKALQEGKFEKAANELEKLQEGQVDPKEAKIAQQKMERVAKSMKDAKLSQLSAATKQMAEGLRGAKGLLEKGSRDLAKQARQHDRRRRLNQLLAMRQDFLNECKNRCQSSYRAWIKEKQNKQNPGAGAGAQQGDRPLGDKSNLSAQRLLQEIAGLSGDDGPGDVETDRSTEGDSEKAARTYRELYQKYSKMSDAVIEREQIPLGYRQTIRTYFELIHPRNITDEK
jgi:hypothetical protein